MFKELNGITTLGLVDKGITGMALWDAIWNVRWKKTTHFTTNKEITDIIYDKNFKKVDKRLEQFIGVYELPVINNPYWVEDFINEFIKFATLENILITRQYKPINTTLTCAEFYNAIADLTTKLRLADYTEGMINVDEKRTMKIMKYVRQQLNKFVAISDGEFEKEEFVKLYMKMKETKNTTYLVLTNSLASILGMSSYAPDVNNDRGKQWTSCMSGHPEGNISESVICNITDENSLLAYVTDGTTAKNMMFPKDSSFNHQTMIIRTQVRMLIDSQTGKPVLVIDRAYPTPMYTEAIYNLLADLVKNTDVTIGMYRYYNTHQGGKNFFESAQSKLIKGCKATQAAMANKILTTPTVASCCPSTCKSGCSFARNTGKCAYCSHTADCKKNKTCYGCEEFKRNPRVLGNAYYDDQSSGRYRIESENSKFIQYGYEVYIGIEKNIRKGE